MNFLVEQLSKIGFDWRMALFSLINFLIIFWVLKKLFFESIVSNLNNRSAQIKDSVENIERAKTVLQMAEQRSQNLVDEAKIKSHKIIEQTFVESMEMKERMKDKAKTEIELLINQAKRNLEIDKREMKEALRQETVELVIAITEKILKKEVDVKKQKDYLESIFKEISLN